MNTLEDELYGDESDKPLTDNQELYAQMRAAGHTKSDAASKAFDTNNPRQVGYATEKKAHVRARIQELKEERAEAAGIDSDEQLRRYNDMYREARRQGKDALALKIMERIDLLCGFESPKKSERKITSVEVLKGEDISEDIRKFSGVLKDITDDDEEKIHH
jgi:hypothetical protein